MISDVFCKIIKGELPGDVFYKDEEFLVIKDIHPEAPVHLLVIPIQHVESLEEVEDAGFLGRMMLVVKKIIPLAALEKGYRVILNEGEHGGKLVPHLHVHVLGGKRLGPKLIKE